MKVLDPLAPKAGNEKSTAFSLRMAFGGYGAIVRALCLLEALSFAPGGPEDELVPSQTALSTFASQTRMLLVTNASLSGTKSLDPAMPHLQPLRVWLLDIRNFLALNSSADRRLSTWKTTDPSMPSSLP